jgi:hypothetical protein
MRRGWWLLALLLGLLGCDHNPLGFDQLERGLQDPQFPVTPLVAAGSYGKFNANGPGDHMILGRDAEYESRVLLRFALQDSALDSVTAVSMVLYTREPHAVPFRILPTITEWDDYQVTWHDAKSGEPWFTEGGDFDTARLATSVVAQDSTIIDLDQARLRAMVAHESGIILVPEPVPAESVNLTDLYTLSTSGKRPKVMIHYGDKLRTYEATQNTFIVDTLALNLRIRDQWVGSGYVFRSYLKFNVDSVPASGTVVTAELRVRKDTAVGLQDTVTVGVHRLTKDYSVSEKNAPFDGTVLSRSSLILDSGWVINSAGTVIKSDSVVTLDLRSLVQFWTQHPDSNFGLLVTMEPENSNISRVELSRGVLPSLRVAYVTPPRGKY